MPELPEVETSVQAIQKFKNQNIGLIMCGGNIDFDNLKF